MLLFSPSALLPRTLIAWALLNGEPLQLPPVVHVVVSEVDPLPVRNAAADLCLDIQEVLQRSSLLISKAPADGPDIVIESSLEGSVTHRIRGACGPERRRSAAAREKVLNGGVEVR